jgi:hypothetical protein
MVVTANCVNHDFQWQIVYNYAAMWRAPAGGTIARHRHDICREQEQSRPRFWRCGMEGRRCRRGSARASPA